MIGIDRRQTAARLLALGASPWFARAEAATTAPATLTRPIPTTGEAMPVVGLGSWITFNVGTDRPARAASADIIRAFFAEGGRMIDCSPMYGSSQGVIGEALAGLKHPERLFSAEKVWVGDGARGVEQMEATRKLWGVSRFDLMQVHNLLAWQEHLPRLLEMKGQGRLRYVGITTSEGRRHDEMERVMRSQPIDFVQWSHNLADREVEQRLLPLAQERGIAVIANRPFRQGDLLRQLGRHKLPGWAADVGCTSWAQAGLKFVIAHPAVTCVIPATSRLDHLRENMAAMRGPLPDAALRKRMAADVAAL